MHGVDDQDLAGAKCSQHGQRQAAMPQLPDESQRPTPRSEGAVLRVSGCKKAKAHNDAGQWRRTGEPQMQTQMDPRRPVWAWSSLSPPAAPRTPSRAKRLECAQLAAALGWLTSTESAGKPNAPHTLRDLHAS
jgi:hypothetical protein